MSIKQSKLNSNFKAINLACGGKLCHKPGWINADHSPSNKGVVKVNLLKRLPFEDNTFDVVYHSQFIEHLLIEEGSSFFSECFRVLKSNGVLRVVTPDFGNQAAEYLKMLKEAMQLPNDKQVQLKYDWIRLEMLDQLTRQDSGGDMVPFLSQSGVQVKGYLQERLGRSGDWMIPSSKPVVIGGVMGLVKFYLRGLQRMLKKVINLILPEAYLVGKFRLSGEAHLCMYDEYLLSKVLTRSGFANIVRVSAEQSQIQNWKETSLDSDENGNLDCPASLFMEAVKR